MSDLIQSEDVTEDSTIGEVAEAAYYEACISDSSYHGVNHNTASRVLNSWARQQTDDSNANAELWKAAHDEFKRVVDEKRA